MKLKKNYLLFLIITILAFNSCSSSENENLSETFLEKFNGKILKSDRTSNIRYYLFKNDLQNPLIVCANSIFQRSTDCFRIFTEYNSNDNLTTLINEEIQLRFKIDYNNNYLDVVTFTIVEDKIKREIYENTVRVRESSSVLVESILT